MPTDGYDTSGPEQWKETGKDAQEFLAEYTPKMYQPQEVGETQELYEYISTKPTTKE